MLTDGRTDGRRSHWYTKTGILIAHLRAFGSGELKTNAINELSGVRHGFEINK